MTAWMRRVLEWLVVVSLLVAAGVQPPSTAQAAPGPAQRPVKLCEGKEHEPNDKFERGGGCAMEVGEWIHGSLAVESPTVTDPAQPLLDRDWFEFAWPEADAWYLAEVLPDPGVDAWLVVQRPDGASVGYSDGGGPGAREAFYFKTDGVPRMPITQSEFYVVGVGASVPTQGGYTLRITRADPPTPTSTPVPPAPPTPTSPAPPPPPPPAATPAPPGATPASTPAPPSGGSGRPRATATVAGKLAWRLVGPAYQTAPLVTTLHVLIYYDVNGSRGPEPGEGVAGLSVRAIARGQFVGWGVTNAQGEAELVVVGPVDRVVVPFLNVQHDVRAGAPADLTFRLEAVRLPTFLPVEGE